MMFAPTKFPWFWVDVVDANADISNNPKGSPAISSYISGGFSSGCAVTGSSHRYLLQHLVSGQFGTPQLGPLWLFMDFLRDLERPTHWAAAVRSAQIMIST